MTDGLGRRLWEKIYPLNQQRQQHTLEKTLFTYCDGLASGEIGMHWSFDWLLAPKESFALSVGRFFEINNPYCHITFKHQTNREGGTKGLGVIYEVRLPVETFRFDEAEGRLEIDFAGNVKYQIRSLTSPDDLGGSLNRELTEGWAQVSVEKRVWRPGRRWKNRGQMLLLDGQGGRQICQWRWDYEVASTVDRPDYDAELLLFFLERGLVPSGHGHFIPAMRANLVQGSEVRYRAASEDDWFAVPVEIAYLDGNYGRAMELDKIITDRWAWMAAPQLWNVEGLPVECMMTFGFFQKPLLPALQSADAWTGAILWRRSAGDMTRFTALKLFDTIDVRFHSPRYLDVTIITSDRKYRVTVRAWSETMTTPLATPSGRKFHDHQDLLADAYVVIEENERTGVGRLLRPPRWRQISRLVTNMFGFEFGEQDRVIGTPGYPAYDAVPQMPPWFLQALSRIPDELGHPTPCSRLAPINS